MFVKTCLVNKREFIKNISILGAGALVLQRGLASNALFASTPMPKQMIDARYFEKLIEESAIKCLLCPHACVLKSGQTGICRTRTVDGDKLITKAYGNPVAIHVDPIEKKPLHHFLPAAKVLSFGTAGCNLRCLNCQNSEISQFAPDELAALDYSPSKIVSTAIDLKSDGIAFTYTEPTVFFEFMIDTAKLARAAGLKTIVISNGYINPEPLSELITVTDAFNIDLKAFDDETYKTLCGAKLQPVLETLKFILASGSWLEITNLLVSGYTDKLTEYQLMVQWLVENGFSEVPLHISRFFPSWKLIESEPTSIEAMESAFRAATDAGMKYVYTGNLRGNAHENTLCPVCRNVVIKREGFTANIEGLKEGLCSQCGTAIPGVWTK